MAATCTLPQGPAVGLASLVMALRACTESSFSCPGPVLHHTSRPATTTLSTARCCQHPPARYQAEHLRCLWILPSGLLLTCPRPLTHKGKQRHVNGGELHPIAACNSHPAPTVRAQPPGTALIASARLPTVIDRDCRLQTPPQGVKRPAAD